MHEIDSSEGGSVSGHGLARTAIRVSNAKKPHHHTKVISDDLGGRDSKNGKISENRGKAEKRNEGNN